MTCEKKQVKNLRFAGFPSDTNPRVGANEKTALKKRKKELGVAA